MPKKHLTTQFIKNLKLSETRVEYYDCHLVDPETSTVKRHGAKGLMLRLTKSGNKYFYFSYWHGGKSKKYKIGIYPNVSLADARDRTKALAAKVNEGFDPQAEKRKRKQRTDPTLFQELAEEFKDKYLPTLRDTTQSEYKRIIDVELVPVLGKYPIDDITPNQIMSLLDEKAYGNSKNDPAPVMANRIRARLSKIYNFAIARRLSEKANPVTNIPKYKKTTAGKDVEQKRNRYYSPEEIQKLWAFFDKWGGPTGSLLKMLLITGQRKTETMKMKWADIRDNVWTIPASLAKNKDQHLVPLSDMALEIIEDLRPTTGKTDYVFASPKKKNAAIDSISRIRQAVQNDKKGVADFRPHDLRRTVATYMAKLGVDRTVLGKILNHKGLAGDDQVTAIYDRHGYMKEKQQAMNRWSHRLEQILKGKDEAKITKLG